MAVFDALCINHPDVTPCGVEVDPPARRRAGFACLLASTQPASALRAERVSPISILRLPRSTNVLHRRRRRRTREWN